MIETRRIQSVTAGNTSLVYCEALSTNRNRSRTLTDAAIGIHCKVHGAVTTSSAAGMYPTRGGGCRPTAPAGRGDTKTSTASRRTLARTGSIQGIGASDACLIDCEALSASRNRSGTLTDAAVGIDGVADRSIAIAAAARMYPARCGRSGPRTTGW